MAETEQTDTTSAADHSEDKQIRWILALTVASVVLGAFVLLLAIGDEPYHIDELRQVRAYDLSTSAIIDASFAQTQPPLDSLLNASAQGVIGVGDWQQRALSVLFGIGSLVLFGLLSLRAGFGFGAPVAVALLGLSPLLVSVTAYARPYALPLLLILAFLLASDVWIREGRKWTLPIVYATAVLLPLSRTVEPPIVLASVAVVLLLRRYAVRRRPLGYSIWVPVSAALLGLVFVATPVALRLRREVTDFTEPNLVPSVDQLRRLVTELPGVLADAFPLWPVAAVVVIIAFFHPGSRRVIVETWWFWVLTLVAIGFAVVFFARVPIDQRYFIRYAFSFWPPFAFVAGALVSTVVSSRSQKRTAWVGAALVAVVVVATTLALRTDLSTTLRADWKAASETITASTSEDTTVIFDHVQPFGAYRTPFAGKPRYVDGERLIPLALHLVPRPEWVDDTGPISVMLLEARPDVEGWIRSIAGGFAFYEPTKPLYGKE